MHRNLMPALLTAALAPSAQAAPLTLEEAIRTALRNNLQVEIAQQSRLAAVAAIQLSEGVFDWNVSAQAQAGRTDYGVDTYPLRGASILDKGYGTAYPRDFIKDATKLFGWGGAVDLNLASTYSGWRNTTDPASPPGAAATILWNPTPYQGAFIATYTQNFLQGFGRTITEAPLVVARKNAVVADQGFRLTVINLAAITEGQYWTVVYAQRDLDNKRFALQLARKQLDESRARLEAGTMAPLDVTAAEVQVAQAEQNLIGSETQRANAKDALARSLYPENRPSVDLDCTDSPDLPHILVGEEEAVRMAMNRRVELKAARITKDISGLQVQVAADKLRPTLAGFLQYNGGTSNYASLGPVKDDLLQAKFPGYTVGFKLAFLIQNRAAKGGLSQARANLRASELSLRDEEISIALEVRTAQRNVASAEKTVQAAEKTRQYNEKELEAERIKFQGGLSTNFVVLQVMTNLDSARTAELQARIGYANAVTALELAVGHLLEARHLDLH